MSDLATWLLEQIAADEASIAERDVWFEGTYMPLFTPYRMEQECKAKRRIVEQWLRYLAQSEPWDDGLASYLAGGDEAYEEAVQILALPYADRPGYRQEWTP